MSIPVIDYSSKDYEALRNDLIGLIPIKCPEWTDFNESDFGIVLIELFAYMGDVLSYYQDRIANESFITTAQFPSSIVSLLKLIDYTLGWPKAASVDLKFTLPAVETEDRVIPEKTQVTTLDGLVIFETVEDLTITAGNLEGVVSAKEGESIDTLLIGTSDGSKNQRIVVTDILVANGIVDIFVEETVGNLIKWEQGLDFIGRDSDSKVYVISADEIDRTTVLFGDGVIGKIPPSGVNIYASYRDGGGIKGNVGANYLTEIKSVLEFDVNVTNDNGASGGEEAEDLESARISGPKMLRTLSRAVTIEDYETLAVEISGVAKVRAVSGELPDWNTVNIYIAPEGGGMPSQALKDELKANLAERAMLTTIINILDPTYVVVDVTADIVVEDNYMQASVKTNVENAIDELLKFENLSFGENFYVSKIYEAIEAIEGVKYVDVSVPTANVSIGDFEIVQQGVVTINATGGQV